MALLVPSARCVALRAYSSAGAISLAIDCKPHVVFLDIAMPDIHGYEVCREIRDALGERVVMIGLSGRLDPGYRSRAADAGFDRFFRKPLDPQEFLDMLEELAAQHKESSRAGGSAETVSSAS